MKKIKIIGPAATFLAATTTSLTACTKTNSIQSIDNDDYLITDGVCSGLKDPNKDYSAYSILAIPNSVVTVSSFVSPPLAKLDTITTISYEQDSKWLNIGLNETSLGFANFKNVNTICFPSSIEYLATNGITNLPLLANIDLTAYTSAPLWLTPSGFSSIAETGRFIVSNDIVKDYITRKIIPNKPFTAWAVEVR